MPEITFKVGLVDKLEGDNHPRYEINTIDELYQIVTPENIEHVLTDLKATFVGLFNVEALKPNTPKLSLKQFTWIDDWPKDINKEPSNQKS